MKLIDRLTIKAKQERAYRPLLAFVDDCGLYFKAHCTPRRGKAKESVHRTAKAAANAAYNFVQGYPGPRIVIIDDYGDGRVGRESIVT